MAGFELLWAGVYAGPRTVTFSDDIDAYVVGISMISFDAKPGEDFEITDLKVGVTSNKIGPREVQVGKVVSFDGNGDPEPALTLWVWVIAWIGGGGELGAILTNRSDIPSGGASIPISTDGAQILNQLAFLTGFQVGWTDGSHEFKSISASTGTQATEDSIELTGNAALNGHGNPARGRFDAGLFAIVNEEYPTLDVVPVTLSGKKKTLSFERKVGTVVFLIQGFEWQASDDSAKISNLVIGMGGDPTFEEPVGELGWLIERNGHQVAVIGDAENFNYDDGFHPVRSARHSVDAIGLIFYED